jgi:hypothetical protein
MEIALASPPWNDDARRVAAAGAPADATAPRTQELRSARTTRFTAQR